MKLKTMADLKRIPIGTELRLVERAGAHVPEEYQRRVVEEVQSNAIGLRRFDCADPHNLSWLYLPKAKAFRATSNGFEIRDGHERVAVRYEFPDNNAAAAAKGQTR